MKLLALLAIAGMLGAQTFEVSAISKIPPANSQDLIQVYLRNGPIAAGQFTLSGTALKYMTQLVSREGPAAKTAGKTVACTPSLPAVMFTCVIAGMNPILVQSSTGWGSSTVDLVAFIGPSMSPSTLTISAAQGADAGGSAIPITETGDSAKVDFFGGDPVVVTPPPPPSTSNCDLNKDGKIDQADVLIAFGGMLTGAKDLSYLGKVVSAANGGACSL